MNFKNLVKYNKIKPFEYIMEYEKNGEKEVLNFKSYLNCDIILKASYLLSKVLKLKFQCRQKEISKIFE